MNYYMTSPEGEKYYAYWDIAAVDEPTRFTFNDGFAVDETFTPNPELPSPTQVYALRRGRRRHPRHLRRDVRHRRGPPEGARHGRGRGRHPRHQPDRRPARLLTHPDPREDPAMRTLVVTEFITLDGVVDSPGGGDHPHAGWTFKDVEFDEAAYDIKGRETSEATALLFGRQSYDEFAPVWPSMEEFATYNAMPKYVVSTTLDGDTGVGREPGLGAPLARRGGRPQGDRRRRDPRPRQPDPRPGPRRRRPGRPLPPARLPAPARQRQAALRRRRQGPKLALVEHAAYSNGITLQRYDVVR